MDMTKVRELSKDLQAFQPPQPLAPPFLRFRFFATLLSFIIALVPLVDPLVIPLTWGLAILIPALIGGWDGILLVMCGPNSAMPRGSSFCFSKRIIFALSLGENDYGQVFTGILLIVVNYFAYSLIDRAIFAHEAKVWGAWTTLYELSPPSKLNKLPSDPFFGQKMDVRNSPALTLFAAVLGCYSFGIMGFLLGPLVQNLLLVFVQLVGDLEERPLAYEG
jgi:hypothetical protein